MPARPDTAALDRLARDLYHVAAKEMLRVRGQKMTPHLEFPQIPHDERGMWRAVAEFVAAGKYRAALME